MKILLPVFFHSAMGGLHLHILASVRHLRKQGHEVTVVCKPGQFAEEIQSLGGDVIETDYTHADVHRVIDKVMEQSFDVVYAHPFDSRQIGLAVAEAKNIPFVLVIHGMYHDDIDQYHDRVAKVIAVSDRIKDYLIDHCPSVSSKIEVIFNGVSEQFQPGDVKEETDRLTGMFISRIDADMLFNLDVFWDALKDETIHDLPIDWIVIGDGTQREKYEARYTSALESTNQTITWLGWLTQEELPIQMHTADFIIAPSRAAMEAMAIGKPTIAAGSKGYHGLITSETWQEAADTNFGGIGSRYDGYTPGQIGKDILTLMDADIRKQLGQFSSELVDLEFRDDKPQRQLEELLRGVIEQGGKRVDFESEYPHCRYEQLNHYRSSQLLAGKLDKKEVLRKKTKEERDEARKNTNQVKRDLIVSNRLIREKDQELEELRSALNQEEKIQNRMAQELDELQQQLDKMKKHPIGKFFA
ncbi:glycosyl transferases group 1 family protein [Exiguobacterium sp. S17]|nr:glycosyl transferases group 1 family protein [Exiguobacterium sp. S17]